MKFPGPLVRGTLVRRYKRFLADVRLPDGRVEVAHCANPGAMLGVAPEGAAVWLSPAAAPGRKLAWSWELVELAGGLVGINTTWPNRIAEEGIRAGLVPELGGYQVVRREVRYGERSRIDLLLEAPHRPRCYVEVKNVHLRRSGAIAEFPDCITLRGAKHLRELAAVVAAGARAAMLFVVQRSDCVSFRVAADLDPAYDRAFRAARAAGVEAYCHACRVTEDGIWLDRRMAVLA